MSAIPRLVFGAVADPIRSDAPVLLISSTIDPITPPRWANEVVEGLGNACHVIVAGSHEGLDLQCLAEIRRSPFMVELPS